MARRATIHQSPRPRWIGAAAVGLLGAGLLAWAVPAWAVPTPPGSAVARPGDQARTVPQLVALLDELEGWAAGTTGGADGTVFVVESLADSGPRTLRAGLESPQAHWILFAPGLQGTIALTRPIQVGDDKTVDGRGHDIRIRTLPGVSPALSIRGRTNVVLTDLTLDNRLADWDRDSEGGDGITVVNSTRIWLHQCEFARWQDGAIDIRHDPALPGGPSHHISVTRCRFSRIFQALNWTADRVSFGKNHCERVRRRAVQIIGGAAHSYNNVIEDWAGPEIQNAKQGGLLYSQRNMFVPGDDPRVNSRKAGGQILLRRNYAFGRVEFLGGSDRGSPGFASESERLARVEVATDGTSWNLLRRRIVALAGPRRSAR